MAQQSCVVVTDFMASKLKIVTAGPFTEKFVDCWFNQTFSHLLLFNKCFSEHKGIGLITKNKATEHSCSLCLVEFIF